MTHNASRAVSQDKQHIPGWKHGEVAHELARAPRRHPL